MDLIRSCELLCCGLVDVFVGFKGDKIRRGSSQKIKNTSGFAQEKI
jgi:hypothetical protein